MLKVKDAINFLQKYHPEADIVNQHGEEIVHIVNLRNGTVIFSTEKPIGHCNRCGELAYPSVVDGYTASCPEHDEDLFSFEFTALPD
jgi:hypothetical protein